MIALIDSDIILYRVGFAAEQNHYDIILNGQEELGPIASFHYKKEANEFIKDEEDTYSIVKRVEAEPLENALHSVKLQLNSIMEGAGARKARLYLTGKDNFREKLATILPYKGNRDPDHKPVHYEAIKRYLIEEWGAQVVDGIEADDALATDLYQDFIKQPGKIHGDVILCTIDKDLDTVPGLHYNFVKKHNYFVTEEEATYNFYTQLLTGDKTDNIQGIPGIGPAKAKKILEGCDTPNEMFRAVEAAYEDYYTNPKNEKKLNAAEKSMDVYKIIFENAQLLWMRREENDMWTPPI